MKTFYEALNELEETNSHIDKEILLIEILKTYRNAENFFRLTFNDKVYGIAEKTMYAAYEDVQIEMTNQPKIEHVSDFLNLIPKVEGSGKELIKIPTFMIFCKLMEKLSGQEQIAQIRKFFDFLEPIKKKWFSRALLHDLRCGVQVKTLNKVFKQLRLPKIEKFAMQLAKKLDLYDLDDVKKKVKYPGSMEMKYDGYRIQAMLWTQEEQMRCILTSRRGNDVTDKYPEVVQELKEVFYGENIILDGEMVAASFQKLTRKDDTSIRKFVVFDLLVDERLKYKDRWDNLISLCMDKGITAYNNKEIINIKEESLNSVKHIYLAEHYSYSCIEDIRAFYEDACKAGEEGIIVKDDNATYDRGSRKNMFKVKPVFTADLEITGYKLGEGKRTGKVATLELIDASAKISADVGSGIDDYTCEELTKQMLENPELPEFVGKICEIKYSEKTETNSLRHPRFVTIRDDKTESDNLSEE